MDAADMAPGRELLEVIGAFVTGETSAADFEQRLYHTPALENLLGGWKAPPQSHSGTTLFHYLIGLDFGHPGHVLNAQGALQDVLRHHGIEVAASESPGRDYDLLLSSQPVWLDADAGYLAALLASAPPLPKKQQKAWLRARILELFRCAKDPPRWLQAPAWPVGEAGPLVFLGQLEVAGYFHDTAVVFVFHDPATGECRSVLQTA